MTAVVLALASALALAVATVVQHRAAADVPAGPSTGTGTAVAAASRVPLLVRLLGRPSWLAGQAVAAVGLVLHAWALRRGAVVVVQPLLSSGLVLTLALGALVDRRHPGRSLPRPVEWWLAGLVAVGLCLFLLSAAPTPGHGDVDAPALLTAAAAALAGQVGAAAWARRPGTGHRALALGAAAGCGYGVVGLLLKVVVTPPPGPSGGSALGWPLGPLVVLGAASVATAQSAYRAGTLAASLPALTALEPVVALALAGPVLGEQLGGGSVERTGQVVGVVALACGIALLARAQARREEPPGPGRPEGLRPGPGRRPSSP